MYSFEGQRRVLASDEPLVFPARAEVELHLSPPEPLGSVDRIDRGRALARPCRTMVDDGSVCEWTMNGFNGRLSAVDVPMSEVRIQTLVAGIDVSLTGSTMALSFDCADRRSLITVLSIYYHELPPLLSLDIIDPFTITWVGGRVGDIDFSWNVDSARPAVDSTNSTKQADRVTTGCVPKVL